MTAAIPGALNVTSDQLTIDMIVGLGVTSPQQAQATLGAIQAFFANLSAGGLKITPLATVGAGTITAAGIAGGITTRSGAQANTAFTDTTDTADAIIAVLPDAKVGDGFIYRYVNNTDATATLAGGTGVTLAATVGARCTATFYGQYTAADTIVFTALGKTTPSSVSGTFTNNGVTPVTTADTNLTANSVVVISLKTVGGTVGPIPHLATVTPGAGFTTVGTALDTSVYNYLIIN